MCSSQIILFHQPKNTCGCRVILLPVAEEDSAVSGGGLFAAVMCCRLLLRLLNTNTCTFAEGDFVHFPKHEAP